MVVPYLVWGFWAEHNNCSQSSQTSLEDYNGDGVSGLIHQHSGCDAETLVQVYEITDMDHILAGVEER